MRTLLDAVPPETLYPALDALFDALGACGFLDGFHGFRAAEEHRAKPPRVNCALTARPRPDQRRSRPAGRPREELPRTMRVGVCQGAAGEPDQAAAPPAGNAGKALEKIPI